MPDDEVVAEHNGETATARQTARAQLSRNVEDGVMWRRDVARYGRRCVAGKPSLCEEQSVQPAADDLVVQQRGLKRVGDGKLIIISITVSSINGRIRFYS